MDSDIKNHQARGPSQVTPTNDENAPASPNVVRVPIARGVPHGDGGFNSQAFLPDRGPPYLRQDSNHTSFHEPNTLLRHNNVYRGRTGAGIAARMVPNTVNRELENLVHEQAIGIARQRSNADFRGESTNASQQPYSFGHYHPVQQLVQPAQQHSQHHIQQHTQFPVRQYAHYPARDVPPIQLREMQSFQQMPGSMSREARHAQSHDQLSGETFHEGGVDPILGKISFPSPLRRVKDDGPQPLSPRNKEFIDLMSGRYSGEKRVEKWAKRDSVEGAEYARQLSMEEMRIRSEPVRPVVHAASLGVLSSTAAVGSDDCRHAVVAYAAGYADGIAAVQLAAAEHGPILASSLEAEEPQRGRARSRSPTPRGLPRGYPGRSRANSESEYHTAPEYLPGSDN